MDRRKSTAPQPARRYSLARSPRVSSAGVFLITRLTITKVLTVNFSCWPSREYTKHSGNFLLVFLLAIVRIATFWLHIAGCPRAVPVQQHSLHITNCSGLYRASAVAFRTASTIALLCEHVIKILCRTQFTHLLPFFSVPMAVFVSPGFPPYISGIPSLHQRIVYT